MQFIKEVVVAMVGPGKADNVTYKEAIQFSLPDLDLGLGTNNVLVNNGDGDVSYSLFVSALVFSSLVILPVNLVVLAWIRSKTRTLVDHMMLLDCLSNIGGLAVILTVRINTYMRYYENSH